MAKEVQKNSYEVVVIVHPDATIDEQKELFRKNKATIASFNGSVFSLETWGKRNLGNLIGKSKRGIYFHSLFEAESPAVAELERTMRINDKVLRYMHTKLDRREPLAKHLETFKKGLQETSAREREREAKMQARRAAAQSSRE
jgi:small subunit ribosomal protein S6